MRKVFSKRGVVFTIVIIVSILLLSGCGCLTYKPIPVKNAAIGLNIESGSRVQFVDEKGEVRTPKPFNEWLNVLLKKHPKMQDQNFKDKGIEKIATINVWVIKGSLYLLYEVDGETVCDEYNEQTGQKIGPCPH